MKTTFVSTYAVSNATRQSVMKMQAELVKLQEELSSGRKADIGLALGPRAGQSVSLRQERASLQTFLDSNAVASLRLSATQDALQSIAASAHDFLNTLVVAKSDATLGAITAARGAERLEGLLARLNGTQNGEYLFGGINTGERPIADYTDPASAPRLAVAAAFQARFGMTQSDPAVDTISPADMQAFLDAEFADLFEEPQWSALWSNAADEPLESRISSAEAVITGATVNQPEMRKLAMVYTMVSDLGLAGLSQGAYSTVVSAATGAMGEALQGVTVTQAALGYSEQAIASANSRLSIQKDILDTHVGELEGIDSFVLSMRVTSLLTQIETSYALTSRIQKLSLLNYL